MKEVFTLRLPEDTRKELETISKSEKVPLGQVVREAIERHIVLRRFRQLRKKALPFAETQGLLTDEDIFRTLEK